MHTLSDKVRFVQRKIKPEEAFRTDQKMDGPRRAPFDTGSYILCCLVVINLVEVIEVSL